MNMKPTEEKGEKKKKNTYHRSVLQYIQFLGQLQGFQKKHLKHVSKYIWVIHNFRIPKAGNQNCIR